MLHMLHRVKAHRITSPLQTWRSFPVSPARRRASGTTRPHQLDAQQSEAIARALRSRQAQLSAAEPFFYVQRKVRRQWPSLLQSLNTSLRKASEDPASVMWQSQLWVDYKIAKERVPDLLASLNDKAWDTLWSTQSIESHANLDPQSRQQALLEDMKSIGLNLTFAQKLSHLEGLYAKGETKEALEQWEAGYNLSGNLREGSHKPEFLELGVRLQLASGDLEKAEKVVTDLFGIYADWHTQLPLQVIFACVNAKDAQTSNRGFEVYRRLSHFLGTRLSLQDYDSLLVAFLKASEPQHAASILNDMMSNQVIAREETDTAALDTMKRIKTIMAFCSSDEEINSIGLLALSAVPPSYCDLLFVEWLRFLRSRNSADSTLKVLELMYERGIKPRSKHFNLMISSLFRTRNPEAVKQAEGIAWKMIDERISAPSPRQMAHVAETNVPFFLTRSVPRATAATFLELLNHYAEARRWDALSDTKRVLEQYQWAPHGAGFLNAAIHAELLAGDYSLIWKRFRALHQSHGLETTGHINGRTYLHLWHSLRRCSYDPENRAEDTPTPRYLMAHMANWASTLSSGVSFESETGRLRRGSDLLSSEISTCFLLSNDLLGQLVAINALYYVFGIAPTPKTAHVISRQLCLVDLPATTRQQRSRINKSGLFSKRMSRIVKVHEMLAQRRVNGAVAKGEAGVEQLEKDNNAFLLNTLSELIRVVLVRQFSPEQIERMVEDAKKEMGVPDIPTGDIDAFSVH
jgi:hypothetical protein